MTNEEIECKAAELSKVHNVKVIPLVFQVGDGERVIGYLKEPPRFVKLRVMDKGMVSPITSASEVIDAYLIKEESNPKIYSESADCDPYYIGAVMEAYSLIQLAVNTFKKK